MLIHNSLFKMNKGERFLMYQLGAAFVFGMLYWLQDVFMSNNRKLSKKLGLGIGHPPADSIFFWMWFSLLTQTTIGYSGPETKKGRVVSFNLIENKVFKTLNFLQFISVFYITSLFL